MKYFISYHIITASGRSGFGNTVHEMPVPTTENDVDRVQEWIKTELSTYYDTVKHATILNWILLPGVNPVDKENQ